MSIARRGTAVPTAIALVLAVALAACSAASGRDDPVVRAAPAVAAGSGDTDPAAPPTADAVATPELAAVAVAPTTEPRVVHEQLWTPFAAAGDVTLVHPSMRIERIAFHESNHDGARDLEPLPTAVAPITLETRERGTGPRTAADVVLDPDGEIRAPVTGVVKRAGTYVLYCDYSDDFVVIAPDANPAWEVKVLHIDGVQVRPGDRVVAAETLLAPRPTRLPFASQVDELSVLPPWPHVHIEVVDPSIPDRPSPGGGCN